MRISLQFFWYNDSGREYWPQQNHIYQDVFSFLSRKDFLLFSILWSGPSIQTTTASVLHTKDDEIAHLTCAASDDSLPSIKWEKDGTTLRDDNPNVAIISWKNDTTIQSHLLVAVTSDDRRGKYTCVASNKKGETRQSFVIEDSK